MGHRQLIFVTIRGILTLIDFVRLYFGYFCRYSKSYMVRGHRSVQANRQSFPLCDRARGWGDSFPVGGRTLLWPYSAD